MVATRALASAVLLVAAGCSPDAPEQDAETAPPPAASGPTAEPPPTAAVEAESGMTLPPANSDRRYVGRWASRADLCEGGAWVFQPDRFGMEDGPMCDFTDVSETPGGYRIEAECEGPRGERSETTFTLRFAESARAMTVEGLSSLPDTGLVYCGPA